MDGTTEPIIAVIGHPIAGNPSQFAVERALREMKLEWRVLSFDVDPEDVAAAIEGFSVIGVAGVLIDLSVAPSASRWYSERSSDSERSSEGDDLVIDCLYRDQEKFVGCHQRRAWVDDQIARHAGEQRILLGDFLDNLPLSRDGFSEDSISLPPDPDLIEDADVIVISQGSDEAVSLDTEDWPENDGTTLVIDLTAGHPDQALMKQLGYRVAGALEQQAGTLQRCLERWTGIKPSGEVIHDAIEEYFGV
jgi:hypothetical protein